MRSRYLWLCFLCLVGANVGALAQESCDAILEKPYYDTFVSDKNSARWAALREDMCASDYSQALSKLDRAHAFSDQSSFGFQFFKIGVSFGSAGSSATALRQEHFSAWKAQKCTSGSQDVASKSAEYHMQSVVNPSVVNAWLSCMTNHPQHALNCFVHRDAATSDGEQVIKISWRPADGVVGQVQSSFLSSSASSLSPKTPSGSLLPAEAPVYIGTQVLPVKKAPTAIATATLNVIAKSQIHSCVVALPATSATEFVPLPPLPPADPCTEIDKSRKIVSSKGANPGIKAGEWLWSDNGKFALAIDERADVRVCAMGSVGDQCGCKTVKWSSQTESKIKSLLRNDLRSAHLHMQIDGNLVIYATNTRAEQKSTLIPICGSGPNGKQQTYTLSLSNDGIAKVSGPDGLLWDSNQGAFLCATPDMLKEYLR